MKTTGPTMRTAKMTRRRCDGDSDDESDDDSDDDSEDGESSERIVMRVTVTMMTQRILTVMTATVNLRRRKTKRMRKRSLESGRNRAEKLC